MKALTLPLFESARLREIASAIQQRGKAIRYHGRLEFSREVEDSRESLQVAFTALHGFRISLSIWADDILWLGITQPGPRRTGGWAYRDEFHSQLDQLSAQEVVERLAQTTQAPTRGREFWPAPSPAISPR